MIRVFICTLIDANCLDTCQTNQSIFLPEWALIRLLTKSELNRLRKLLISNSCTLHRISITQDYTELGAALRSCAQSTLLTAAEPSQLVPRGYNDLLMRTAPLLHAIK